MSRKYSEFLDLGEQDDDQVNGSEASEEDQQSKFNRSTPSRLKRQKLEASEYDTSSDDDEISKPYPHAPDQEINQGGQAVELSGGFNEPKRASNPKLKPLTKRQVAAYQRKAHKTGVIYLSRVPPFMRPSTVSRLLTPYGSVTRLFLTPEPPAAYARRLKSGGNKKRSFIDGWVEFESKKCAKICAETLNGQIIGGKKGGWYHDDIWNVKYLRGFKWGDLMEQIQGEERVREGRMRAEVQRETRERKAFLGNVEIAKREKGMQTKRMKRDEREAGAATTAASTALASSLLTSKEEPDRQFERRFKQNEVKIKDTQGKNHINGGEVVGILSKIF